MLCEVRKGRDFSNDTRGSWAFVLSPDNYTIVIGSGWHEEVLYHNDLSRRDYCYGGRIRMEKKEITPWTGTVGDIPDNLIEVVLADISEFFGIQFRRGY